MHLCRLLYNSQLLQETDFLKNFDGRNVSTRTVCSFDCRDCPLTLRVVELWQARHGEGKQGLRTYKVLTGLLCSEMKARSMKQNWRDRRNWAGLTYGNCYLPTITHCLKAALPVHSWIWSKKHHLKNKQPTPKTLCSSDFCFFGCLLVLFCKYCGIWIVDSRKKDLTYRWLNKRSVTFSFWELDKRRTCCHVSGRQVEEAILWFHWHGHQRSYVWYRF